MIIAQFKNSFEVDDKWILSFMYYDNNAGLHRLNDSYVEIRSSSYNKLLSNTDQYNKTSFRLHFIME